MAAPGAGNQVARRVIDDLLNALIAKMEAFEDQGEVFDTLMSLRDDRYVEETKLAGLNKLITQGEEEIEMKEAQLECFECLGMSFLFSLEIVCVATLHNLAALGVWVADNAFQNLVCLEVAQLNMVSVMHSLSQCTPMSPLSFMQSLLPLFGIHGPFFILDKLSEVAESPRLADKMKYVFGRSRGEDESFAKLVRDLCFALRISLSKKRRLVAELEALGEREGAAKPFEHMKEIVARDAVTLGELETLLARALVGVSLKAGFVADMEEKA
ncbi:hypothetical protein Tco_0704037 [Tanacetum coccineum]|uniref:Uncharacterized protein n=1 Tax=Tanacetum coccineum TaxID=301880 RepID=A0ABQ4Y1H0_9ASTR